MEEAAVEGEEEADSLTSEVCNRVTTRAVLDVEAGSLLEELPVYATPVCDEDAACCPPLLKVDISIGLSGWLVLSEAVEGCDACSF